MDINALRVATTVISFLTFIGIFWWAFKSKNRSNFEEAAQIPFHQD